MAAPTPPSSSARPRLRVVLMAVVRVLGRPGLWATALRQVTAIAPRRWWRRPPFLPIPERRYLEFRLQTQYGSDAPGDPDDLITYLEWCKSARH